MDDLGDSLDVFTNVLLFANILFFINKLGLETKN